MDSEWLSITMKENGISVQSVSQFFLLNIFNRGMWFSWNSYGMEGDGWAWFRSEKSLRGVLENLEISELQISRQNQLLLYFYA